MAETDSETFHRVHGPDRWLAGTIALAAAFLLGGYEFVRSPSNTLFKGAWGPENLPVVMAIMPLGVILVLYAYNLILTRFGPRRTLLITSLGSGWIIFTCYLAIRAGSDVATGVLYVFRQAYIVLIIEQYWSLINSRFDTPTARKLNGPITGISTVGAILGGDLVSRLAVPLGTEALLLFGAATLVPAALLSEWGFSKVEEPRPETVLEARRKERMGLKEFRSYRLLVILLGIVMLTQVLSAALGLQFQTILQREIPDPDLQTQWSGGFFMWVNALALGLDFIGAPLLLRFLPVTAVHFLIPGIHLLACSILLASPGLGTAAAAYLVFKGFDYSVFRAAKEILYIPLSYNARYRAKEFIDVFGYRFSKGGTALAITFARLGGVVITTGYTLIALGAAGLWMALLVPLSRHYRQRKSEVKAE